MRRFVYWGLIGCLFLLSAELTARLDDWLHIGTPLLGTPDMDRDLFVKDEHGMHGRPHGRFKKWRLNEYGFRSPQVQLTPSPERTRVMILGASETFGLFESEDKEYPAQLADRLGREGNYEVINAALPGMTIRSMRNYWEKWAGRFRPDIVVIYPSPLFYLNDVFSPGRRPATPKGDAQPPAPPLFQSRFVFRMKDVVHLPDPIQKWRTERQLDAVLAGKEKDWFYQTAPQDRLEMFAGDVEQLLTAIEQSGARPILLTHAIRSASPPRPEDFEDLHWMRLHVPRGTEPTLAAFEYAAARTLAERGNREGVRVVDVAEVMSGRREWFADLVHFNDEGAAVISELIAETIEDMGKASGVASAPRVPASGVASAPRE